MSVKPLQDGLKRLKQRALDGAASGLETGAGRAESAMKGTTAHGDDTGATRAGYSARVVGNGRTGASEHAAALAAAEALNPGKTATASVSIDGIGVILDSPTTYQVHLERERAGQHAVLGPTLQGNALQFTAAAAEGSRKALS